MNMAKTSPAVTICVVPRERFSCAVDSLRDIVRNTETPFRLVYVDGNAPPAIAEELSAICGEYGFTHHRVDEYLSPNRARNLALERVETRYAVFVDNDLFVKPGWLDALLQCARDTGAWAVAPLVLEGSARLNVIHIAGGELIEDRIDGHTRMQTAHRFRRVPLASVRTRLRREAVGFVELHCVLVQTEAFGQRALFDEGFLCHQEHIDLAREIRRSGGEVYFEPAAVVRHDNAQRYQPYDRAFFERRWSREWTDATLEHARAKWQLAPDDARLRRVAEWTEKHRRLFDESQRPWALRILPMAARRAAGFWLRDRGLLRASPRR
jgi:GT2 family glycosyltransferase